MSALETIHRLPAAFDVKAADGADGVVQLNVSTPVYLTVTAEGLAVTEGTASDPDVTLTASDEDLVAVLRGELDGVNAFLAGQLQVEGDLQLAKDLASFFDPARLA